MNYPNELAERDYLNSIIGPPKEPDQINNLRIRYIGEDKAVVEVVKETPHWSELPKPVSMVGTREYGDNDKSSPEQNLEED